MRLYGAIEKVEAQDDGTVRVYGIATSEAVDEQGEIVRAAAMRAAIPDYMRFPALREMHQLSAAGTTLEAEVGEDGTTRIVAHVVDPVAVVKVKNQVYRGFSIGGRVTQRDVANPKTITGLLLNEISLVDRPANPEATFDCWKAAALADASLDSAEASDTGQKWTMSPSGEPAQEPFNSPIQIWACRFPAHRHLAKADAAKCLENCGNAPTENTMSFAAKTATPEEAVSAADNRANSTGRDIHDSEIAYADPGHQPDGKKRYPIDSERHIRAAWNFINRPGNAKRYTAGQLADIRAAIIAAWKERIDKDGPPSADDRQKAARAAATKALWDVCSLVRVGADLEWLGDICGLAVRVKNEDPQRQFRLRETIVELRKSLNLLVSNETAALLDDTEADPRSILSEMPGLLRIAVGTAAPANLAALLERGNSKQRVLASALLMRANHSRADQMLLDLAYLACDKCLNMGGLSPDEADHMDKACDRLQKAGALALPASAVAAAEDEDDLLAAPPLDRGARCSVTKLLDVMAGSLSKRALAQRHMMDMAHQCLQELTDGAVCEPPGKIAARHSKDTMRDLEAAHRHLVAAGARCPAAGAPTEGPQYDPDVVIEGAGPEELTKLQAGAHFEKIALARVVGEIMPALERLTKQVDEIARTPLPALTMAKNTFSVSKQQDYSGNTACTSEELPSEAIAAALAKMSKEEQTLTLIKASHANPIRVPRSSADE